MLAWNTYWIHSSLCNRCHFLPLTFNFWDSQAWYHRCIKGSTISTCHHLHKNIVSGPDRAEIELNLRLRWLWLLLLFRHTILHTLILILYFIFSWTRYLDVLLPTDSATQRAHPRFLSIIDHPRNRTLMNAILDTMPVETARWMHHLLHDFTSTPSWESCYSLHLQELRHFIYYL